MQYLQEQLLLHQEWKSEYAWIETLQLDFNHLSSELLTTIENNKSDSFIMSHKETVLDAVESNTSLFDTTEQAYNAMAELQEIREMLEEFSQESATIRLLLQNEVDLEKRAYMARTLANLNDYFADRIERASVLIDDYPELELGDQMQEFILQVQSELSSLMQDVENDLEVASVARDGGEVFVTQSRTIEAMSRWLVELALETSSDFVMRAIYRTAKELESDITGLHQALSSYSGEAGVAEQLSLVTENKSRVSGVIQTIEDRAFNLSIDLNLVDHDSVKANAMNILADLVSEQTDRSGFNGVKASSLIDLTNELQDMDDAKSENKEKWSQTTKTVMNRASELNQGKAFVEALEPLKTENDFVQELSNSLSHKSTLLKLQDMGQDNIDRGSAFRENMAELASDEDSMVDYSVRQSQFDEAFQSIKANTSLIEQKAITTQESTTIDFEELDYSLETLEGKIKLLEDSENIESARSAQRLAESVSDWITTKKDLALSSIEDIKDPSYNEEISAWQLYEEQAQNYKATISNKLGEIENRIALKEQEDKLFEKITARKEALEAVASENVFFEKARLNLVENSIQKLETSSDFENIKSIKDSLSDWRVDNESQLAKENNGGQISKLAEGLDVISNTLSFDALEQSSPEELQTQSLFYESAEKLIDNWFEVTTGVESSQLTERLNTVDSKVISQKKNNQQWIEDVTVASELVSESLNKAQKFEEQIEALKTIVSQTNDLEVLRSSLVTVNEIIEELQKIESDTTTALMKNAATQSNADLLKPVSNILSQLQNQKRSIEKQTIKIDAKATNGASLVDSLLKKKTELNDALAIIGAGNTSKAMAYNTFERANEIQAEVEELNEMLLNLNAEEPATYAATMTTFATEMGELQDLYTQVVTDSLTEASEEDLTYLIVEMNRFYLSANQARNSALSSDVGSEATAFSRILEENLEKMKLLRQISEDLLAAQPDNEVLQDNLVLVQDRVSELENELFLVQEKVAVKLLQDDSTAIQSLKSTLANVLRNAQSADSPKVFEQIMALASKYSSQAYGLVSHAMSVAQNYPQNEGVQNRFSNIEMTLREIQTMGSEIKNAIYFNTLLRDGSHGMLDLMENDRLFLGNIKSIANASTDADLLGGFSLNAELLNISSIDALRSLEVWVDDARAGINDVAVLETAETKYDVLQTAIEELHDKHKLQQAKDSFGSSIEETLSVYLEISDYIMAILEDADSSDDGDPYSGYGDSGNFDNFGKSEMASLVAYLGDLTDEARDVFDSLSVVSGVATATQSNANQHLLDMLANYSGVQTLAASLSLPNRDEKDHVIDLLRASKVISNEAREEHASYASFDDFKEYEKMARLLMSSIADYMQEEHEKVQALARVDRSKADLKRDVTDSYIALKEVFIVGDEFEEISMKLIYEELLEDKDPLVDYVNSLIDYVQTRALTSEDAYAYIDEARHVIQWLNDKYISQKSNLPLNPIPGSFEYNFLNQIKNLEIELSFITDDMAIAYQRAQEAEAVETNGASALEQAAASLRLMGILRDQTLAVNRNAEILYDSMLEAEALYNSIVNLNDFVVTNGLGFQTEIALIANDADILMADMQALLMHVSFDQGHTLSSAPESPFGLIDKIKDQIDRANLTTGAYPRQAELEKAQQLYDRFSRAAVDWLNRASSMPSSPAMSAMAAQLALAQNQMGLDLSSLAAKVASEFNLITGMKHQRELSEAASARLAEIKDEIIAAVDVDEPMLASWQAEVDRQKSILQSALSAAGVISIDAISAGLNVRDDFAAVERITRDGTTLGNEIRDTLSEMLAGLTEGANLLADIGDLKSKVNQAQARIVSEPDLVRVDLERGLIVKWVDEALAIHEKLSELAIASGKTAFIDNRDQAQALIDDMVAIRDEVDDQYNEIKDLEDNASLLHVDASKLRQNIFNLKGLVERASSAEEALKIITQMNNLQSEMADLSAELNDLKTATQYPTNSRLNEVINLVNGLEAMTAGYIGDAVSFATAMKTSEDQVRSYYADMQTNLSLLEASAAKADLTTNAAGAAAILSAGHGIMANMKALLESLSTNAADYLFNLVMSGLMGLGQELFNSAARTLARIQFRTKQVTKFNVLSPWLLDRVDIDRSGQLDGIDVMSLTASMSGIIDINNDGQKDLLDKTIWQHLLPIIGTLDLTSSSFALCARTCAVFDSSIARIDLSSPSI
jgi:hypothetical protein